MRGNSLGPLLLLLIALLVISGTFASVRDDFHQIKQTFKQAFEISPS